MKKKLLSQSAFFNLRTLLGLALCLFGFMVTLYAAGVLPGAPASKPISPAGAKPGSQKPDVVSMAGPISQDLDLRMLPYAPPNGEQEDVRRTRHPFPLAAASAGPRKNLGGSQFFQQTMQSMVAMSLPSPMMTFDAIDSNLSGCGCLPPDSDGDVGSKNYIASMNSSIMIFDKGGNVLAGPITYNSFFAAMGTSTTCGNNLNDGDGIVFYDHIADRWVVSDFAFGAFPGAGPFMQCIGVSKTSDPVSGGWYLYALQVDPANPTFLGDYPKFGLWPDAYYVSMNEFSNNTTFNGVRMYALDRNSMINGGPTNAVGFTILPAVLGDQYSFMAASFRTGNPPPAGQAEWVLSVNSSSTPGTVETQVFVRRFHADFINANNSTLGVTSGNGAHDADGIITVNGFIDGFTTTTSNLCPNGTATATQFLDTLGDKIMTPVIYQNLNGKEYLYADQTIAPGNNGTTNTAPTAVRWYQLDMTGNTIPATPTQQQDFTNGNDGLYRWMPSINVDGSGNMAIGYSVSSTTVNPGIRYAGRLYTDSGSLLTQGETVMTAGTGHQTSTSGRWGDYSALFVDPIDNCTFWHTNEYYSVTGSASWRNRVGLFKFSQCTGAAVPTPTPTPTATPIPSATPSPTVPPTPTPAPVTSPTPSPTPPASAGNVTVVATAGTVGPTGYATLQAAFAAINAGTHQGNITVWIMASTTETTSCLLNGSGVGSASYSSILVLPNGTQTVSGAIAAGSPLIDLNGAKNVRIDGYNQLTLANTTVSATASTSTIRFISTTAGAGGAQNNTIANCSIQGSATAALGTAGGNILFSTTTVNGTVVVGNNNNIIANNDIGPAGGNLPLKCISAVGTTTNANTINTGNIIVNNNIHDFFSATASNAGMDIRTGNTSFSISGNRIYQTASRSFTTTAGLRYSGIVFSGSTGAGATGNWMYIVGNTIGFGAANGTGTTTISGGDASGLQNEVRGIDLQAGSTGTATQVYANTVSGINQTSSRVSTTTGLASFAGISASTAAGGSATGVFDIGSNGGNTIGSLDGSSTIVINASSTTASTAPVVGVLAQSGSGDFVGNNKIGAITIQGTGTVTGFRGIIDGATAATTHTVSNNFIGGSAAGGAITDTQVGSYALYGIQTSTAAVNIYGNTIQNINGNSNGAGLVVGGGIVVTSTSTSAVSTISRNNIFNLNNNSGTASTSIYGMDLTMSTTAAVTANLIERNMVHSFTNTSTDNTSQLYGMIIRGANTTGTISNTVQNNMVQLGLDSSGNPITSGLLIRGIRDAAAGTGGNTNNSFYFNSVYIGGNGVASSSNTHAFFSDQTTSATSPRNFKDNIFYNARSNASGAGKNYAIQFAGTAPNPTGLTSNNNDLYVTGTGGFVGSFNSVDQATLANWQAATGQDGSSISADPLFVNPNGTATTGNLHIAAGSPAIGAGVPVTATLASPLTGILNDIDNYIRSATTPTIGAAEFATAPALQSVVSRLTHGGAGPFDLTLSTSSRIIEPRADGTGNFTIVYNFSGPVTSGNASVSAPNGGSVSNVSFSGNSMIVSLTGVTDQQTVTVSASNVGGNYTETVSPPSVQVGFLWGDVTQDGFVNVGDTIRDRNFSGVTLDNTNFQYDVNIDGMVNVGDAALIRSKSGDFLP